jgi:lipopolysaccharide transport system permease protein
LLPWDSFSDAVGSGSSSLLGNRDLISKVYFPRLLLPISRIVSSLVDFCITFVILIGMLIFYRITPNLGVLLLPFFLLLGIVSGLGLGLWFSGIIVKYRDFGQVTGYMLRFLMYASPVVYSSELVPPQLYVIYHLNPMANVIDGFRWALLNEPAPDWTMTMVSAVIGLAFLISGLYHFRRVERSIVDIA